MLYYIIINYSILLNNITNNNYYLINRRNKLKNKFIGKLDFNEIFIIQEINDPFYKEIHMKILMILIYLKFCRIKFNLFLPN